MKTTGECLSAETIEAGGKTHTAFVFIKPHANNEKAAAAAAELAWLYTLDVFFCGGGVVISTTHPLGFGKLSELPILIV